MLDFDDLEELEANAPSTVKTAACDEGTASAGGAPSGADAESRIPELGGPVESSAASAQTHAEAPQAPSLSDLREDQVGQLPRCIYSLKGLMNFKKFKEVVDTQAPGAHYKMLFPHSFELLRAAGPEWLTEAFQAAGTLPPENRVISMTLNELGSGGVATKVTGAQGLKALLDVEYLRPHPELHTQLFVKLPFPYSPTNDRQKNSLTFAVDEPEILLNRLLGRLFPFKTPKYYFGEFSYETTNYILITERIAYKETSRQAMGKGQLEPGEIEAPSLKYRDVELPLNGFRHCKAIMAALGKLVAQYHTGGLGKQDYLRYLFPREATSPFEGIGWEAANEVFKQNGGKLTTDPNFEAALQSQNNQALSVQSALAFVEVAFVRNAPKLFPKDVSGVGFLKQWYKECMEVVYYSAEISFYLHMDPAFISLAHPNATTDNAWFWHRDDGELDCGLLDWGGAMIMNIAMGMIPASWSCMEPQMLKKHAPELIRTFVDSCREEGGPPTITYEEMTTCIALAMAVNNAGVGGNATQLLRMKPKEEWATRDSTWAPDEYLMRNYVCATTAMLSMWKDLKVFTTFKAWRRKNERWMPTKKPFTCPPIPSELK